MRSRLTAVLGSMLVCGLALAAPAHAAFPGENGNILFTRWFPSGNPGPYNPDIFTVNPDVSGLTDIDSAPQSDEVAAWSPDGTKIAFSRRSCPSTGGLCTPSDIYVMNADGTGQVNITNNALNNYEPTWSPGGTKIAFVSDRSGSYQIYVINATGTGETQLTSSGANVDPAWSPDGSKIAFTSINNGIYVMNADGTGQTPLTNGSHDYRPDWAPDGSKLAFVVQTIFFRAGESDDIYSVNADGSGRTPITTDGHVTDGYRNTAPAYSPDGTKIVFERAHCYVEADCDTGPNIHVMNADGTGITNITNSPATYDKDPDWQPIVNHPPDCSGVTPSRTVLTTINRSLVPVTLDGVTDPDGDPVTLSVDGVTQDEPVTGSGDHTSPDAVDAGEGELRVRAERNPHGDGRVYRIAFTAFDGRGGSCSETATVSVPRKRRKPAVDSAPPSYDSLAR